MSDQFPAFDFLTGVFPTWTPCQYEAEMALQSVVVPMLVLINNEKKYSNSVDVLDQLDRRGQGGSGIPIYPLFCPKDTNIPQNRKMCDTKYLKLF